MVQASQWCTHGLAELGLVPAVHRVRFSDPKGGQARLLRGSGRKAGRPEETDTHPSSGKAVDTPLK